LLGSSLRDSFTSTITGINIEFIRKMTHIFNDVDHYHVIALQLQCQVLLWSLTWRILMDESILFVENSSQWCVDSIKIK